MPGLEDELDSELRELGLDPDLQKLEDLAAGLHERGIDFSIDQGRVVLGTKAQDREIALDFGKHHIKLGIISDTHAGSSFEQLTALRHFYSQASGEGVDAFIHCGDWTQGPDRMHRDQYLGLHAHGADAQVNYAATVYPTGQDGQTTYGITGNHDDSFLVDGGTNVVRRIANLRPDISYVGQDAAYLTLGNLRMYLIHPDGGGAYAKTYKMQKIAPTIPLEKNVNLLLVGHYHNYATVNERDTFAIQLPCFQSQYSWLARKALHPDIGGIILDVWLSDAGRIDRVRHELIRYPVIESDWDQDVSFEMAHRWSPKGVEVPR